MTPANAFAGFVATYPGGRDAVAKALTCSRGMVGHLISGRRQFSEDMATKIEALSAGEVSCETIRPDLQWERDSTGRVTGYRVSVVAQPAAIAA